MRRYAVKKENMTDITVQISAGDLAEYCFPEGSLGTMPSVERMHEGTAAHKKLQNAYSENESISYKREVPLECITEYGTFSLKVQGRADGIFTDKTDWFIHEIKTTYCDFSVIEKPLKLAHKAQMMIYAYIFATENSLDTIRCRLSYFCLNDNNIVDFEYTFTLEALCTFYKQLTDDYATLIRRRIEAYDSLKATAAELKFPFEAFRKGQREGAMQVYTSIKNGKNLFLQAPTGSGKTLMALFPTVKHLAESNSRVFCLSAKNQTISVTHDTVNLMRQKGLKLKSCIITAKAKCCKQAVQDCTAEACPYSADFYKKLHDALPDILSYDDFDAELISSLAEKYTMCPHELSLALAEECNIIVCDYNYLFDPTVYLRRFFDFDGDYIFLIDEAHNLPERCRDMYSAEIHRLSLREAKKKLEKESKLYKKTASVLTELNKLMRLEQDTFTPEDVKKLNFAILSLNEACEELRQRGQALGDIALFAKDLWRFAALTEYYTEEDFLLYKDGERIKLQCLDASLLTEKSLSHGSSAIMYSATLSPYEYYKNSILPNTEAFGYNSVYPFDEGNLTVLADYSIETRYRNREMYYGKIAEVISDCRKYAHGNIIAYFPSYKYMRDVFESLGDESVIMQKSGATQSENDVFIKSFTAESNVLGFAVMGSHFSEGIDFEALTGIIIVGVALPQFNAERQKMQEHFEKKYNKGFEYAYVYPGINKVCQSSGRLIRRATDSGFILLLDSRFRGYGYLLPDYWHIKEIKGNLKEMLLPFN